MTICAVVKKNDATIPKQTDGKIGIYKRVLKKMRSIHIYQVKTRPLPQAGKAVQLRENRVTNLHSYSASFARSTAITPASSLYNL